MNQIMAAALVAALAAAAAARGDEPKRVGQNLPPQKLTALPRQSAPPVDDNSRIALTFRTLSANLVKNGHFENGRYWPQDWEPVDRLSCFWEEQGGTLGKRCLRHDTNIINEQGVKWNSKVRALIEELAKKGDPQKAAKNPLPEPPKPLPTKAPYYDTLAGLEGVIYLCDPMPHRRGAIYRVSLDARTEGGGTPICFVKGYVHYKGRVRNCGRLEFHLTGIGKDWKRFSALVQPEKWKSKFGGKTVHPEFLKIQLFSYWTPGNYYYDNVRLEIVGWEPYDPTPNPKDLEKEAPPKPKSKGPDKADSDLGPGDFPTFD
jgi:hypothetical protein